MSNYQIERWGVITGNNVMKYPLIYVKPDTAFLEFIKANDFAVLCEIEGTGMHYDCDPNSLQKIAGLVNRSSAVPNCRPNYFADTELYTVTLLAPWIGYPSMSNGRIRFFGMEKGMEEGMKSPKPKIAPLVNTSKKSSSISSPSPKNGGGSKKGSDNRGMYIGIGIGVLVVLVILGYIIYRHQQHLSNLEIGPYQK